MHLVLHTYIPYWLHTKPMHPRGPGWSLCVYIHKHISTHMHTYIHTYIHTLLTAYKAHAPTRAGMESFFQIDIVPTSCVCVCVCMYIYMYVYMYVTNYRTRMYHMFVCMCACIYVCLYIKLWLSDRLNAWIHTCVCIHANSIERHMHTYIFDKHMHTHEQE
jgi:hypothetical protein